MPLLDPMCGAGTFLSEAAEMSLDRAAGRNRDFALRRSSRASTQRRGIAMLERAKKARSPLATLPIYGSDLYGRSLGHAALNLREAGLEDAVTLKQVNLLELSAPGASGMIVTNPPYGVRLGEKEELARVLSAAGRCAEEEIRGLDGVHLLGRSGAREAASACSPRARPCSSTARSSAACTSTAWWRAAIAATRRRRSAPRGERRDGAAPGARAGGGVAREPRGAPLGAHGLGLPGRLAAHRRAHHVLPRARSRRRSSRRGRRRSRSRRSRDRRPTSSRSRTSRGARAGPRRARGGMVVLCARRPGGRLGTASAAGIAPRARRRRPRDRMGGASRVRARVRRAFRSVPRVELYLRLVAALRRSRSRS